MDRGRKAIRVRDRCRTGHLHAAKARRARGSRHPRILAGRHPIGNSHDRHEVHRLCRLAAQRSQQHGQRLNRVFENIDHRRSLPDRTIKHAVQHALDLPREVPKRPRADQSAAALEGVERTADRLQGLQVIDRGTPQRQLAAQVVDLLDHLLDEHLANLVVDLVGRHRLERRRGGRFGRRPGAFVLDPHVLRVGVGVECPPRLGLHEPQTAEILSRRRLGSREPVDRRCASVDTGIDFDRAGEFNLRRHRVVDQRWRPAALEAGEELVEARHRPVGRGSAGGRAPGGQGRLDDRIVLVGCGRLQLRAGDLVEFAGRGRLRIGGHRPVAERLQAGAGHVEDALAAHALLSRGLDVVFDRRDAVGEPVHLLLTGHPLQAQQLDLDEATQRVHQVGRRFERKHPHRAGDFLQEAGYARHLRVIPGRLDEGDHVLLGLAQVLVRFLHHRVENAAHLGLRQSGVTADRDRPALRQVSAGAEAVDVLVQRGLDEKQCARDVEQSGFVCRAAAGGDSGKHRALLLHQAPRHAEAEHAQRIGDPVEDLRLRAEVGCSRSRLAQMQIERILDPQQVVLDRHRDRVEQDTIAPAQSALGVAELLLGWQQVVQPVGSLHLGRPRVGRGGVRDVVEQTLRQLARRLDAESGLPEIDQPLDLAVDAPEQAFQRGTGLQRTLAQRLDHAAGNPPQPASFFLVGAREQTVQGAGQALEGLLDAVVPEPAQKGDLEAVPQARGLRPELQVRHGRRGAGGRDGQRGGEIGREQHALRKQFLAAAGSQVVEQRQKDDGNVLVTALQSLQIVGQLHHAAHQHGVAVLALAHLLLEQRSREPLHLLDQHRRAVQLDHAQGSLHLVQVTGAEADQAGIGRILDVRLQGLARLLERRVELLLDPAQGGEVEVFLKSHGLARRPLPSQVTDCA